MSITTLLQQLSSWLGSTWRGQAYSLLEQQIAFERTQHKEAIEKYEARIKSLEETNTTLMNRLLERNGVRPTDVPRQAPKDRDLKPREFGPEGALREAKEKKLAIQELAKQRALAWKAAQEQKSTQVTEPVINIDSEQAIN